MRRRRLNISKAWAHGDRGIVPTVLVIPAAIVEVRPETSLGIAVGHKLEAVLAVLLSTAALVGGADSGQRGRGGEAGHVGALAVRLGGLAEGARAAHLRQETEKVGKRT